MTKIQTKKVTVALLPPHEWDRAKRDWLIGPVGQCRDSNLIEETNFSVLANAMDDLDPNGADWEILNFKHWHVGWIEEMATRPGSLCAELADAIRARLEAGEICLDDTEKARILAEKEAGCLKVADETPDDSEECIYAHV